MITETIQKMNNFFYTKETYTINRRISVLKKLKNVILEEQEAIQKALFEDFGKPSFETYTTEIYMVIEEINYTLKHLKSWAKSKKIHGSFPILGGYTKLINEPYGVCVIFSPFNYPFQLAISPLIGAIAAGNCAVIKPSEYTPSTNKILKQIISKVFPPYYVSVIEGNEEVAKKILNQPIDYIFFTGSIEVGKKIMRQASNHLIPVTLELGGKSPVIVEANADLKLAAKRIVWGKFLNAGQTCVAPDYVLVHESVANKLLDYMSFVIQHFYKNKKDMARIINEAHYVRLLQLIDEDKIYFGGHFNTDSLYIEPTLLYPTSESDLCMKEEIFGPILPIIPYKTLGDVVKTIQRRPKPLACYIFSQSQRNIDYLLKHISFGGGCINDTILHLSNPKVPFGGVGYSGLGNYHGYASFKTFSHQKSIFVSSKTELPLRYPPYTESKINAIKALLKK